MGKFNPVTRDSDGKTIRLDKQEAEESDTDARAKRVISVDDSGSVIKDNISTGNSSTTPLLAGIAFTGDAIEFSDYSVACVAVYADVEGTISMQQSSDGTNWRWTDDYTISAGANESYVIQKVAKYFRVVYTNGASEQTTFDLSTILSRQNTRGSSHRLGDNVTDDDDVEVVKSILAYKQSPDDRYKNVDIQNPLPSDGDSVYAKDIWVEQSDLGDFSGSITDLFDNLHTVIENTTSDNPKTLLIHFNRTIVSNVVGFGCTGGGDFSNIKIEIVNSGPEYTTVYDDSADDTKHKNLTAQLPVTAGFNAIRITFHTADEVCLSNLVILKTRSIVSRLQAKKPDNTIADINATAGGNLKMSLEELESGISVNSNSQLKTTQYDSSGTEVSGKFYDILTSTYKGLQFNDVSPQICSQDYLLALSEGDVAGHTAFAKYGRVSGINNSIADIWYGEGGTPSEYVFPTTAQQMDIVSSSTNDDDGGTGVNSLYIEGLDSNYAEISETITLNGTTEVTTVNSYLRLNACRAATVGSLGYADGNIVIQNAAGTITYGALSAGLTVCRDLIYTVPAGKTLFLTSITVASGKGGNTTNLNAVIFTPKVKPFGSPIFYPQGELLTINSDTVRHLEVPAKITEKSDVKMTVKGDYASGDATCITAVRGWLE